MYGTRTRTSLPPVNKPSRAPEHTPSSCLLACLCPCLPALPPTMSQLLSTMEIQQMIDTREQARSVKDWSTSDKIREDLRARGVEVYDRDKEWKTSDGRRGVIGGSGTVCMLTDQDIQTRIAGRENARMNKDWATADRIRSELRALGVEIHDKNKVWKTTDGRSGALSAYATVCSLSDEELESLVKKRDDARRMRDFSSSDQLREQLRAAGVELFDSDHVWKSTDGRIGVIGQHLTDASINMMLNAREVARQKRDFGRADKIRDQLRARGLQIFDKEKMWKAADGRQGYILGADGQPPAQMSCADAGDNDA